MSIIRVSVLVSVPNVDGQANELYDIEPNDYYEPDLAKRTRFYNALADVKLLNSQEDFGELPELISIWILPYDPFGDNRMIYTVKNVVTDNPDLKYNDGVTNLFLYTEGKFGGSKELERLLKHMTDTTADNALNSDLKQIQEIVDSVKSDREVGERYMSMEKIIESSKYHSMIEGRAEGRAEERAENIKIFIESLQEFDIPVDAIKTKLLEKFKLSESEADEYLKNICN